MGTRTSQPDNGSAWTGDDLPSARELHGRRVVDGAGQRIGVLDMVIRTVEGERIAVVNRGGRFRRRLVRLSLTDAAFDGERIRLAPVVAPVVPFSRSGVTSDGGGDRAF